MTDPNAGSATEVVRIEVDINLDDLREIALQGVRRAYAFVGLCLPLTENYIPTTLALSGQSMLQLLPEPTLPALGREVVSEFRAWTVGNSLKELDVHFSLFLDKVWELSHLVQRNGLASGKSQPFKSISKGTSIADKAKYVTKFLDADVLDLEMLKSLHVARNCLTHNLGIVETRHCQDGAALEVFWMGLELRLQQGDQYVILKSGVENQSAPDVSQPSDLTLCFVRQSRRFTQGDNIVFLPEEIHSICFTFQHLAGIVCEAFQSFANSKGVMHRLNG